MRGTLSQRPGRREIGHVRHWYSPPSRLGGRLPQPDTNVSTAQRDVAPTTVHVPFGVGDVTTGALCAAVAVLAAAVGWWITGAAVALPLALVGGVAVAAAIEDTRTGRIPNGLIVTGIIIVASSWGFVAVLDNRLMGPLARRPRRRPRTRRRPRRVPCLARRATTDRWRRLEAARRPRRGRRLSRARLGQRDPDGRLRGGGRRVSRSPPTAGSPRDRSSPPGMSWRSSPRSSIRRCSAVGTRGRQPVDEDIPGSEGDEVVQLDDRRVRIASRQR